MSYVTVPLGAAELMNKRNMKDSNTVVTITVKPAVNINDYQYK